MSQKKDRAAALRARATALMRTPAPTPPAEGAAPAPVSPTDQPSEHLISAHFGIAALDQIAGGRTIQRLPTSHIAPDLRPENRQPRLLPLPEDLMLDGQATLDTGDLVAGLLELGQSLRERQIQPIVVFPGSSDQRPAARYLILVGQRRWTAACLVGLNTIDAVVVDPPSDADRVRIQYAENEDRADFSDMERVWALQQMKRALNDAPWEQVEARFQMSRGRRQELLRLAAFTPDQQMQIARLRLRETQLRPLHSAVRGEELPAEQVDHILGQLVRLAQRPSDDAATKPTLDGPTIARLVARARRTIASPAPPPAWLPPLIVQLDRTEAALARAARRAPTMDPDTTAQLRARLLALGERLSSTLNALPDNNPESDTTL